MAIKNQNKVQQKKVPQKNTLSRQQNNKFKTQPFKKQLTEKVLPVKNTNGKKNESDARKIIRVKQQPINKKVKEIVKEDESSSEDEFEEMGSEELGSDSDVEMEGSGNSDASSIDSETFQNLLSKSFKSTDPEDSDFEESDVSGDESDSDASDGDAIDIPISNVKTSEVSKQKITKPKVKKPKRAPQTSEEAKIDVSTEVGKLMKEIDDRKNNFTSCIVAVRGLNRSEKVNTLLSKVNGYISKRFPTFTKRYQNSGYGFIYFGNNDKAKEATEAINKAKLNDGKVVATIYNCNRVYSNFKHVDLTKLVMYIDNADNMCDKIKSSLGANCTKVIRNNNASYEVTMNNSVNAMNVFKENKNINGCKTIINFVYDLDKEFNNVMPNMPTVGKKRSLNDSIDGQDSKKIKMEENKNTPNTENKKSVSNKSTPNLVQKKPLNTPEQKKPVNTPEQKKSTPSGDLKKQITPNQKKFGNKSTPNSNKNTPNSNKKSGKKF